MFLKSYLIEICIVFMDLLKFFIFWFGIVILNGVCRCICNGYVGFLYMYIGDFVGENVCCCSMWSSFEFVSMLELCFFFFEMNEILVKLMFYLKSIMYYFCY